MLVLTPSQVVEMASGAIPEAVRGTVKKVWPSKPTTKSAQYVKPGESDQGSLQKLIITDGTTELEVMFDGRENIPATVQGSKLYVVAYQKRDNKGLGGLKRKDNTYQNKTTPQLWVYDGAEVTFEGASGGNPPAPAQRQQPAAPAANGNTNGNGSHAPAAQNGARQPAAPASNGNPPAPAAGSPAARASAIKDYNRRVARATTAYERCFDAAYGLAARLDVRHKDAGGFKPNADTLEKMAACIMVQSCWTSKPSDIEAFPVREFSAYDKDGVLIGSTPAAPPPAATNGNGAHQPPARNGAPFSA